MIISGTCLEVEQVTGSNDGRSYAYFRAHILDGLEVYQCRIADDYKGLKPESGEVGSWDCVVTPFKTSSGVARLSIRLTGEHDSATRGE